MLLAFTGAGISAASGIPTFQDQDGIRDKLDRHFANTHPQEYQATIQMMADICRKAEPNDAHRALVDYDIPVITMNVDELHQRAGSQHVLPVHGSLFDGTIVLYGDPAPRYSDAESWVGKLREGDIFLIVGTSYYTNISFLLKRLALRMGADVIEVNDHAETKLREELEAHKDCIESFEVFMAREDSESLPPVRPPYSGGWEQP